MLMIERGQRRPAARSTASSAGSPACRSSPAPARRARRGRAATCSARTDWSYRMFWLTASVMPASLAQPHDLLRLAVVHRQRLLGEDAADVRPVRSARDDHVRLQRRAARRCRGPRRRRVGEQLVDRCRGRGQCRAARRRCAAFAGVPRGDRDRVEAGLAGTRRGGSRAMMKPLPMQPMRQSLRFGRRGR